MDVSVFAWQELSYYFSVRVNDTTKTETLLVLIGYYFIYILFNFFKILCLWEAEMACEFQYFVCFGISVLQFKSNQM